MSAMPERHTDIASRFIVYVGSGGAKIKAAKCDLDRIALPTQQRYGKP
jgi:hypothetical protein